MKARLFILALRIAAAAVVLAPVLLPLACVILARAAA